MPVDAVFCLGNSLSHLLSPDTLQRSLEGLAAILRAGGVPLVQILNYEKILATRERVQSSKMVDGTTFVRSYDYEGDLIKFNILKRSGNAGAAAETVNSIFLRPVLRETILPALLQSGFNSLRCFGGIAMDEFDPKTSQDLVILAIKRQP